MTMPRTTSETSNQRTNVSITVSYDGGDVSTRDVIYVLVGELRDGLDQLNANNDIEFPNAMVPSVEFVITTTDHTIDTIRVLNDHPF